MFYAYIEKNTLDMKKLIQLSLVIMFLFSFVCAHAQNIEPFGGDKKVLEEKIQRMLDDPQVLEIIHKTNFAYGLRLFRMTSSTPKGLKVYLKGNKLILYADKGDEFMVGAQAKWLDFKVEAITETYMKISFTITKTAAGYMTSTLIDNKWVDDEIMFTPLPE